MVSLAKQIFGIRLTRLIAAVFILLIDGTKKIKQRALRKFSYDADSQYLALGERIEYRFPNHWIGVDWEHADHNINLKNFNELPFKDNSKQAIYSAHVFEHLGYDAVEKVLSESHRILVNGGVIRIEVPDAGLFVEAYKNGDAEFLCPFIEQQVSIAQRFGLSDVEKYKQNHIAVMNCLSHSYPRKMEINGVRWTNANIPILVDKQEFDQQLEKLPLKQFFTWAASLQSVEQLNTGGHQCGFTYEILEEILLRKGFSTVTMAGFGLSNYPYFGISCSDGSRAGIKEKAHRKNYSVYVEAQK